MTRKWSPGAAQAQPVGGGRPEHITTALLVLFSTAQAVSLFGDRLNNFSLAALINRFSADPSLQLAWFYLAMNLPAFLLAPMVGVIIDRLSKRWVLVVTDLARCLLVLLMPALFHLTQSFLPLMAVVFLLSTGNLFFLSAKAGLIPEIVPPQRLVRVNSILWGAWIAGFIGGFLGGGLIFDYYSWQACFYLNGATYLCSAALLLVIAARLASAPGAAAPAPPPPGARRGFWHDVGEGLSEIRNRRPIRRPLLVQVLVSFGAGGFSVLAIGFIRVASAPGSSMGLAAAGLSAGIGMALGSYAAQMLHPGARRAAGMVCFLLMLPAAILVARNASLVSLCAGAFTAGLAVAPLIILSESDLQASIPARVRGRVFSLREVLTRSLFLLSAFVLSMLGRVAAPSAVTVALGVFLAIMGSILVGWPGGEDPNTAN